MNPNRLITTLEIPSLIHPAKTGAIGNLLLVRAAVTLIVFNI